MPQSDSPRLPVELERQIVELAAMGSLKSAASLMLVSQRMRKWIEPILYSVFRLDGWGKPYPPCYATVKARSGLNTTDNSPLEQYGQYILHLYIRGRSARTVTKILRNCPHVENLMIWMVVGVDTMLVEVLEARPLKKLSIHAVDFLLLYDDQPPTRPLALSVTHLDLMEVHDFGEGVNWQTVVTLPNLTHLRLIGTPPVALVQLFLSECRKLERLVVVWPRKMHAVEAPSSYAGDFAHIVDKRLAHVVSTGRSSDLWKEDFPAIRTIYDDDEQ
ncbi:hypothetical protein HYPSUDRAFT_205437 [Hypholoma sublateritium FD-334 SS-4]|uniref:F-box domain-containing protein n=1 Tax=Hypholoma sublateritium (strain FD-334 SS-4) TaxID=945553 RepID=A0A0D2KUI6_HYPSF|nr:hypothetical protein HYPSUDRAFT_205437 [Hypholoma sublateritium FD-334 SS-4]